MSKKLNILLITLMLSLVGCNNTTPSSETESVTITDLPNTPVEDEQAQASEPELPNTNLVLPLTENTSGKVQIQTVSASKSYPFTSYLITSPKGETIALDPTTMPTKDIIDLNPAAIISTHTHPDHLDTGFNDSYDCPKSILQVSDISTQDFHITTLRSSHDNDMIDDKFPTNTIAIVDVDNLRIVHMGDIGQTYLTDEQLDALGHVDIVFMQFENSYSNLSLSDTKAFDIMAQLNPSIIIPTHYTEDTLPLLEDKYGTITHADNVLCLSKEDIPSDSTQLYIIDNTHVYQ